MSGVQLGGLVSGMDTEAVIAQLIAVDRQPRIKLELRQIAAQARQDALGEIKSKLSALQTAATALRSAGTWGDVQSVESSDPTKVAVRQLAGAAPGGSRIEVTQLARAEQRTYDFTPQVAASQITVGGATIDLADGATITDAVSAINGDPDAGVYAVDVGGRLVLSSRTTGAASTVSASGASLVEDAGAAKLGLDAQLLVDGVPKSSSSNVVTDAVPGLELTLKGLTTAAVDLAVGTPGPDKAAVEERMQAFVDAYNGAVDLIRGKLGEKSVVDPKSSTDAKKGVLFGDPALRGLLSNLRSTVGATIAGNPEGTDALADLGVSTGAATGAGTFSADAVAGKLTFDAAAFRSKLETDPTAVQRLLGGVNGTSGVAHSFEDLLGPSVEAGGSLEGAASAAGGEVTRLKDALARLDDRLARREDRLRAQFTALEQALARSQRQQTDLLSALGGLQ